MLDAEKIWKSEQLPTLPQVAVRLLELSKDPNTELPQIVELIKSDPAISAKLLQAANSSYFAFKSKVTTIERAVPLLGTTVVTSLSLSFSLSDDSILNGPLQHHYRKYWKQSIVHAVAGEVIGLKCAPGLESEFFLGSLLLDIGRLAMLKTISREYFPVLLTSESQGKPLWEVEEQFLGLDHALVSDKLMASWGLPESLMNGVRWQHVDESQLLRNVGDKKDGIEAGMALANAVGEYFISPSCGLALKRIRFIAENFFGMDSRGINDYLDQVRTRIDAAGDLFSIDMSGVEDPQNLMGQANEQLLQLTIQAQAEAMLFSERQKQIEEEKLRLESQNQELQEKAARDSLTGISNRACFDEKLSQAIQHGAENCQPVGLIFADIDKFKVLNDTYGHQFGDQVLKRFASIVQDCLRADDLLARFGGEEFVIIVHNPSEKGIGKLADRIRSTIEKYNFQFGETKAPVTSSFGTSILIPSRISYDCGEKLVEQADQALYEAKRSGRNRVVGRCLYTAEQTELVKGMNQARFSRWLVANEILEIPAVSRILLQVAPDARPLGQIAQQFGFLLQGELEKLLNLQKEFPAKRFGELAVEEGYFTTSELMYLLAWQAEPPERLVAALLTGKLFSLEKIQQLYERYKETCPIRVATPANA